MKWDPELYLSFERARLQPALDLINRIAPINFTEIADLGCGPGNVTPYLQKQWPNAFVTGYDSSEEMIAKAKQSQATSDKLDWKITNAADFQPDKKPDLIYSNACLQWLPNHDQLFPNLIKQLSDQAVLAVQMPNNYERPTHQLVAQTAKETGYEEQLQHLLLPPPVHSAGYYYDLLTPYVTHLEIWETDYHQILEGENPVADWTKGSYLRPFLQALSEKEALEFEHHYRNLVQNAYPAQSNGKTVLPFKRLFIMAIK